MSQIFATTPRRRSILFAVAGLAVLGGLAGASAVHHLHSGGAHETGNELQSSPPLRRVHALGRLEPAGTIRKISPRSGNDGTRIERLLVREGDDVESGRIIAILDNQSLRQAILDEAEARLALSRIRLEQVKAGAKPGDVAAQQWAVTLQSEQWKVAERELKRAQDLNAKNVLAKEDLDNKQWLVDRAKLEFHRAEELLKSVSEVREIDVRVAEHDVALSEAAVRRARVDLDAAEVHSPAAGRVLKILTHEGERISDQGLLELGDVLHMEAVAEVFESDVAELQPGLRAAVTVDCLPEPLRGEVVEVGHRVARKVVLTNDPVSDTDARVVEVRITLVSADIPRVVRFSNARIEVDIELPSE